MKIAKIILLFLTIGFSTITYAQSSEIPSGIITALNDGNAAGLTAYMNNNIELVVANKNDIYSRQQAGGILSEFFSKNKVAGFQTLHRGNKESACFLIGTLKTSTGNYRVHVLTRKAGNSTVIQQLRIEQSNE